MILQTIGDRHLIYTGNPDADYLEIGKSFGMTDPATNQLNSYVEKSTIPYVNSNGVSMQNVTLKGKTVTLTLVKDTQVVNSRQSVDIANALNYFPNASLKLLNYSYMGKFSHTGSGTVTDKLKNGFTVSDMLVKDLGAIYDLMTHLDLNNGKLFEPLIARYVYATRQISRRRLKIVGYFDLEEYLRIMKDDRKLMFNRVTDSKSRVYIKLGDHPLKISVQSVVNGYANLVLDGQKEILDLQKANSFRPFVIMTLSPLQISSMKFPWSKVMFENTPVFMTPLMTSPNAWGTLQGGVDLLAKTIL